MKGEADMNKLSSEELSKVAGGAKCEIDGSPCESFLCKHLTEVREFVGRYDNQVIGTIPQNDKVVLYMDTAKTDKQGKTYYQLYLPYQYAGCWVCIDDLYNN